MHGKAQKNKAATSSEPIEVEEVDVDVVLVARTFSSADSETLEKGILPFILHFVAVRFSMPGSAERNGPRPYPKCET